MYYALSIFVMAFVLMCLILTFISTGFTGKIVLSILFIVGAVLSFTLPGLSNSTWSLILGIVLGLGCFIYLLYNGYIGQVNWWWRRWR